MSQQSIRAALAAHEATRNDKYSHHRIEIAQERYEAWVDVTVLIQRYGDRLTLVSAEWTQRTRATEGHDRRVLSGPTGAAYWIPAREGDDRPGSVYARHASGGNSHGINFDTNDSYTACDLLALASEVWDTQYSHHGIDSSDTNPFRPYVPEGGWEARDTRAAAYEAEQAAKGGRA